VQSAVPETVLRNLLGALAVAVGLIYLVQAMR
jgi:hypothetical protein